MTHEPVDFAGGGEIPFHTACQFFEIDTNRSTRISRNWMMTPEGIVALSGLCEIEWADIDRYADRLPAYVDYLVGMKRWINPGELLPLLEIAALTGPPTQQFVTAKRPRR